MTNTETLTNDITEDIHSAIEPYLSIDGNRDTLNKITKELIYNIVWDYLDEVNKNASNTTND